MPFPNLVRAAARPKRSPSSRAVRASSRHPSWPPPSTTPTRWNLKRASLSATSTRSRNSAPSRNSCRD